MFSDEPSTKPVSAYEAAQAVFKIYAQRDAERYFTADQFRETCTKSFKEIGHPAFRKLCFTAIATGMISSQEMAQKFGDAVPRNLKQLEREWCVPKESVCRDILNLFKALDPDNARSAPGSTMSSASKLPWRHASPRPTAPELHV